MGRAGGQVVSVLEFYSNDLSLNPTEVYNFYSIVTFKRTQENEKETVNGHVGLFRFKYIKTKEVPGI